MAKRQRGAAAPAPAPPHPTPRERIAQIRAERQQSPPPAPTHVLTLTTLDPEPRYVTVDEVDYRLRFYDELPLAQHARLVRTERDMNKAFDALTGDDAPDLDDDRILTMSAELDDTLNAVLRSLVPGLPERFLTGVPAVVDGEGDETEPASLGLTFAQRWDIWLAFRVAQAERAVRLAAARAARRAQPTGVPSSTPSPSPTGSPRATGPTKRRSATSSTPITA